MKPVVALDIDGTLGDYHGHFTRFAADWTGKLMPSPDAINPGQPLYKHLGISRATYRECKLAYRRGGLKRSMPAYDGAADLVRYLRRDAEVWITTTRPYLRYDGIDPDTRHWLRRNGIYKYDGLIFKDSKLRGLRDAVGEGRVIMVVDDLPEQMAEAARVFPQAKRVIRDQPYNQHYEPLGDGHRVWKLQDIKYHFRDAIFRYEARR
jgi:hypothetical protein